MALRMKIHLPTVNHSPGSTVEGKVHVRLTEPSSFDRVIVQIYGQAAFWLPHHGHYSDVEAARKEYSKTFFSSPRRALRLPGNSSTANLPAGNHYLPFSFELPQNLPSSLKGQESGVDYEVRYQVVASIKHTKCATLTRFSIEGDDSNLLHVGNGPLRAEKTLRLCSLLCFNNRPALARVSIPRGGFSPGESIPISITLGSYANSRTNKVSCWLEKKVTVSTSVGGLTHFDFHGTVAVGQAIMLQRVTQAETSLVIPADVHPTFRNCSHLGLEYTVVVKVHVSRRRNLYVKIPVVIAHGCSEVPAASFNLRQSQPQHHLTSQPQQVAGHQFQPQHTPPLEDSESPPLYSNHICSLDEPPAYHSLFPAAQQFHREPELSN